MTARATPICLTRAAPSHILRLGGTLLIVALLTGGGAVAGEAQVRRGRAAETGPVWAPVSIGARFGWDQRANGQVLGAQLRVPVIRSGIIEVVPNIEMAFLRGTNEYQYNMEAALLPGGAGGGILVGGGVGWREAVLGSLDLEEPRTRHFGYVATVGARGGSGRLQFELALRWTFLRDTEYRPNSATIGINYAFWSILRGAS